MKPGEGQSARTSRVVPIASPTDSIHVINKAVSVLFGYKKPATYKDIAAAVGLHEGVVSRALSASRDLGITELAGKKGLYRLTLQGEEYARFVQVGKTDEAKLLLGSMIRASPAWSEIVAFLRATLGQTRDPIDMVLDAEKKLGKKWSQAMRQDVRASYVSILDYAGLIRKEGENVISTVEATQTPEASPLSISPRNEAGTGGEPLISGTSHLGSDFAEFKSDDFLFRVRKDAQAIAFAKSQFAAWSDYLEKKTSSDESSRSRD
jgi:DNA-binding transcriptional ArsR family regulator